MDSAPNISGTSVSTVDPPSKAELGPYDEKRVKFLVCQEVPDEIKAGSDLLAQLADYAGGFRREDIPASELVVGMKCGGSDGLSGITANPAVGRLGWRASAASSLQVWAWSSPIWLHPKGWGKV